MKTATKLPKLPAYLKKGDLREPAWKSKDRIGWDRAVALGLPSYSGGYIEFWYTESCGWVMPTLTISNARRGSGLARRTYAVGVDGNHYRVGMGPHVLHQVVVYLRKSSLKRLMPLIDLLKSGEVNAHETRDRISTRRARTALRRFV